MSNAAASRAIDRLVQRGLIRRSISQKDRRAVDLDLTRTSWALLERFRKIRNAELDRLLGDVPEPDLRMTAKLLDRLSVRLLEPGIQKDDRCLRCGIHFRTGCVVKDVLGRECAVSSGLFGEEQAGGREEA